MAPRRAGPGAGGPRAALARAVPLKARALAPRLSRGPAAVGSAEPASRRRHVRWRARNGRTALRGGALHTAVRGPAPRLAPPLERGGRARQVRSRQRSGAGPGHRSGGRCWGRQRGRQPAGGGLQGTGCRWRRCDPPGRCGPADGRFPALARGLKGEGAW